MKILSDEEIIEVCSALGYPGATTAFNGAFAELARAVESAVLSRVKKQMLEEVCFKMASGSPNRQRIHDLMKTWEGKNG